MTAPRESTFTPAASRFSPSSPPAARSDQYGVRFQFPDPALPGLPPGYLRRPAGIAHGQYVGARSENDPLFLKSLPDAVGDIPVFPRHQHRPPFEHRHFRAERGVHGGEFEPDVPAGPRSPAGAATPSAP